MSWGVQPTVDGMSEGRSCQSCILGGIYWCMVVLLLIPVSGCESKRKKNDWPMGPYPIYRTVLDVPMDLGGIQSQEAIRMMLESTLEKEDLIKIEPSNKSANRLEFAIQTIGDGQHEGFYVGVALEIRTADGDSLMYATSTDRILADPFALSPITVGERQALIDTTVNSVLQKILSWEAARQMTDAALRDAAPKIAGAERDVISGWLKVCAERKLEGVETVILTLPMEKVLMLKSEWIDAVTELRLRAALPRMLDLVAGESDGRMIDIIRRVEKIGGRVAKGWLFTLSTGHSSAIVREEAENALSKISSRS